MSNTQYSDQLNDVSNYIYGTTRLGEESIPRAERIAIAKKAMDSCEWFHVSDQYGTAIHVLADAFKEVPNIRPKMIFKIEAERMDQMREVIHNNIDPLGVGYMDIGQLCLRDRTAADFCPGSTGYEEYSKIKSEGLVKRFVMEVFPWTSDVALEALKNGCTDDLIDGFIFYFNPLQRFATNELWDLIQEKGVPVIAMRTVCGNNVVTLRDVPGAAWKEYIQQRATEVAPLFEQSGINSWGEFCMRFAYSFPLVRATVGSTAREENLNEFLRVSELGEGFPENVKGEVLKLQQRWSDELDKGAEAWSM